MPNNYKKIELQTWFRKDAFHFYRSYQDPFFNLTADVEVGALYRDAKKKGQSFFIRCLHLSLQIANEQEAFSRRILKDELVAYDQINGGSAILNDDRSMSFCFFDYDQNVDQFLKLTEKEIVDQQERKGIVERENEINRIHFSVIPWVSFTSFKHAHSGKKDDCIPKIVFGKIRKGENGSVVMPLSIEAHHSMMDGYEMGLFFERFEELASR
ncbi:CatA-like O-acetyltransferase [Chitinophagales bacterium]|nr:CatA-like O-acetyltransferase [Chitinophagales bacterium]